MADKEFKGLTYIDKAPKLINAIKSNENVIENLEITEDVTNENPVKVNANIKNKDFFQDEDVVDFLLNLKK